ncbi:MAG: hypothetical protein QXR96_03135, partial [Candidatus Woesearchaeota archaeon]
MPKFITTEKTKEKSIIETLNNKIKELELKINEKESEVKNLNSKLNLEAEKKVELLLSEKLKEIEEQKKNIEYQKKDLN